MSSESSSTAPPASAVTPNVPTVQQQMLATQTHLQSLQLDMQALLQAQAASPDPNCGQTIHALQQKIILAQSEFQSLFLQFTGQPEVRPPPRSNVVPVAGASSNLHQALLFTGLPLPSAPGIATSPLRRLPATGEGPSLGNPSIAISPASMLQSMGFEEVPLPPGPSSVSARSAKPRPTKKAKSAKSAKPHKIEDVFSSMGSAKVSPKPLDNDNPPRSPTPATVENTTLPIPVVLDGFPALPPFEPTDMSWEDVNIAAEAMIYPEELEKLLKDEEPLVDKRGGRPSSQTLAIIDSELANMDIRLNELSKKTGISITNVLRRWNTTKTRGASLWNTYQQYFTAHKAEELSRLSLDPTTQVTGSVRSQAYVAFRKAYPETWPEVLGVWAQYAELENGNKSVQQRALAFRRTWRTICDIVSPSQPLSRVSNVALTQGASAQRRHGFVLAAVMAGNEIHHDHSLVDVYEAKDAEGVRPYSD